MTPCHNRLDQSGLARLKRKPPSLSRYRIFGTMLRRPLPRPEQILERALPFLLVVAGEVHHDDLPLPEPGDGVRRIRRHVGAHRQPTGRGQHMLGFLAEHEIGGERRRLGMRRQRIDRDRAEEDRDRIEPPIVRRRAGQPHVHGQIEIIVQRHRVSSLRTLILWIQKSMFLSTTKNIHQLKP
jgi:hypothetical protein